MRTLTLHRFIAAALVVVMFTFMTAPARALDTEHRQKAEAAGPISASRTIHGPSASDTLPPSIAAIAKDLLRACK